jgi:fatty-acid peroxygenase
MEEFTWRGQRFPRGSWLLLDIYATNHDTRIWGDPEVFRPERFRDWDGSPFDFVPQGGGDHAAAHRCAGEWITIRLTERAVRLLTGAMTYEVPAQDLGIDLATMPAAPASGLVLQDVRLT